MAGTATAPRRSSFAPRLLECAQQQDLGALTGLDWTSHDEVARLLDEAHFHRLDALLADLAAGAEVSAVVARPLAGVRLSGAARRASLVADLGWLAQQLGRASVRWVVLKGPVTAARHYARPSQRSFSDLDVLVSPEAFAGAVEALVASGARLFEHNWSLVRRLGCGELNFVLPQGTYLDLHWSIIAAPHDRGAFRVVPEEVLDRAVAVELASSVTALAPDPVDELVHLCLHAVVGGTGSIGRLRDVVLASSGPVEWDEVVSRSRSWRVGLPVAVALERSAAVWGRPVDDGVLRQLAPSAGWRAAMRLLGRWFPETAAPPVTRWSSHTKLTRATPAASYLYALTEVLGYLAHPVHQRARDRWDQRAMQQPDGDEQARAGYFADVAATARVVAGGS